MNILAEVFAVMIYVCTTSEYICVRNSNCSSSHCLLLNYFRLTHHGGRENTIWKWTRISDSSSRWNGSMYIIPVWCEQNRKYSDFSTYIHSSCSILTSKVFQATCSARSSADAGVVWTWHDVPPVPTPWTHSLAVWCAPSCDPMESCDCDPHEMIEKKEICVNK